MNVELAAAWATVVTSSVLVLLGATGTFWWFWKRRKRTQNLEDGNTFLSKQHSYVISALDAAKTALEDETIPIEQRIVALLVTIEATQRGHYYFTAFNYIVSNQELSYLPDWIRDLTVQWPVKKKDDPTEFD